MKNVFSFIAYYLLYTVWFAFSLLPFCILYVLSDFLYFISYYVVKYRRRVIRMNITSSFPEKNENELRAIEKGFYHWFCDYLVETIKLMTMSKQQLMRHLVFTGTDVIDKYIEEERSCGVYLGHYGQWEWITSLPYWISDKGLCTQIYHPLENKRFDSLFKKVREKQGARCIAMAETLRRVVAYQQQKQPIVMGYISDQVPFWNNIHHWFNFLNHDTPVLTGTEKIIKATNQVVFYCDVSRIKRGYYRCDMQLITDKPREKTDFELTDLYFKKLQATIRRDPTLYLWSHNRWKRTREEFNLRYDEKTGRVDLGSLDDIKKRKQIEQ